MPEPSVVPRPDAPADGSTLWERVRTLRGDARVGAAVLACVAVAAGVAWFRAGIAPAAPAPAATSGTTSGSSKAPSAYVSTTTSSSVDVTSTTVGSIVVDVVGAVRRPGVVTLPGSARVLDAIRAAGGAAAGADLARLNLAAKLADGARVAVPLVGEPPPAVDPSAVSGGAAGDGSDPGTTGDPAAPIDVNTATEAQLEQLPGIGPTLAAAIVQERERNGPFTGIDDLTRVHGIGPGRLAQLRGFVAF